MNETSQADLKDKAEGIGIPQSMLESAGDIEFLIRAAPFSAEACVALDLLAWAVRRRVERLVAADTGVTDPGPTVKLVPMHVRPPVGSVGVSD